MGAECVYGPRGSYWPGPKGAVWSHASPRASAATPTRVTLRCTESPGACAARSRRVDSPLHHPPARNETPMFVIPVLLLALQQPAPAAPPAPALPPLPRSSGDTSVFRRLDLPAPTLLREGSGAPGPKYWQQRADYVIRAALDTGAHAITGRETIRYTNHSPDTLRYVWLQVDQNIYREDSRGAVINPTDARWSARGFEGGYVIDTFAVRHATAQGAGRAIPLVTTVNGTMLRADLDRPLPPGGVTTFDIAYRFQVPAHGSDRMGREQFPEGWLYEIAEWYPRMVVYDDVHGWNTDQYLGQGEFYLEYGDIDFSVTVPRNYIVAGSGTLVNPLEVLTAAERGRLTKALRSDTTVAIVTADEAGKPATRPAGRTPTLTWHFSAKNVRDVAWAAAPNFRWDASGWQGILLQSYYPPEANADWANSDKYVHHTISHYSDKWFHYPYPTAINIAGPVGGMEYPMIVFCGDQAGGRNLFGVTTHELGHQWFPMIVGSNERRYAWMDEGFNTFINIYSERAFYHDTLNEGSAGIANWARFAATGRRSPRCSPPTGFRPGSWAPPGTTSRRSASTSCATRSPIPPASTPRSASTSAAGRTSIPRRRTSSAPWRTAWARISPGSGAPGSTGPTCSISRWTRWARRATPRSSISRTTGRSRGRSPCASPSPTGRLKT